MIRKQRVRDKAAGSYSVDLKSGTPAITDIGYSSTVSNDQPERSGWRYYRVPDIASQLGTLGWQLELDDAPPGTQISIRRALAPGTWKRRVNGATSVTSVSHVDFSSANGILQWVDHEADIWYVGVYRPDVALGNFTLTLNDIAAVPAPFDAFETTVADQVEGGWRKIADMRVARNESPCAGRAGSLDQDEPVLTHV